MYSKMHIVDKLLNDTLKLLTEAQLKESQSGYGQVKGVRDPIFTVKQLIEQSRGKDKYVAFKYLLQKSFQVMPRNKICVSLERR